MKGQQLLEGIGAEYARLTEKELVDVGVTLGAYRSFRGNRRSHISYVGMPITTGKRFYDVLGANGVRTREELALKLGPKALFELVIQPNVREGIAFADSLGKKQDRIFIAPSVFDAKPWKWTDDAYMALWYRVIGELAGQHFVFDGWQYSTGGVREVLFSMFLQWRIIRKYNLEGAISHFGLKNFEPITAHSEKIDELEAMWGIRVFDSSSKEITIDLALQMVVEAIADLKTRGFPYQDLLEPAMRMKQIPVLSPLALSGVREQFPSEPFTPTFERAGRALKQLSN